MGVVECVVWAIVGMVTLAAIEAVAWLVLAAVLRFCPRDDNAYECDNDNHDIGCQCPGIVSDTVAVTVVRSDDAVAALPVGSVLFDVDKDVIVRAVEGWRFWGDESDFTEDATICLPAMLIHRGQSEPWHAA